ncbi:hypothetical protein Esti_000138 [Eimeria stiedai]
MMEHQQSCRGNRIPLMRTSGDDALFLANCAASVLNFVCAASSQVKDLQEEATAVYCPPCANDFRETQELATTQCSLLLASSSVHRRALFVEAAIPVGFFSSPFDEDDVQVWLENQHPQVDSSRRTLLIAQLKANAAVHALLGPQADKLQLLRLNNQLVNVPEAERGPLLEKAEREARCTGKAAAAVAQLASLRNSAVALEMSDGRRPVLITVDTGVEHEGQVLFKPKDKAEAEQFLERYSSSGASVLVATSVVLVDLCGELDQPPDDPNAAVPTQPGGQAHRCSACCKVQRGKQDESEPRCCCPVTVAHAAEVLDTAGGPMAYRPRTRVAFTVVSTIEFKQMDPAARSRMIGEEDLMGTAGAIRIEGGEMAKHLRKLNGCHHNIIGFPLSDLRTQLAQLLQKMKELNPRP